MLNRVEWDADEVLGDPGDPDAVLVVDDTRFEAGDAVGRGAAAVLRHRRTENCQVAVFLLRATDRWRALNDRRLYLMPTLLICGDGLWGKRIGVRRHLLFTSVSSASPYRTRSKQYD